MASPPMPGLGDDTYVGVFMVEQPPGWWLPDGYSLTQTGATPVLAWDPTDQPRMIYPVPGYRPPPTRVDSIAEVIERELGPVPTQGIGPKTREALGMNRDDLLGTVNRTIMAPIDLAVALLDLANYGIDAGIVAGTEGAYRAGWMSESDAGSLRRDLMLLSVVAGIEAGRAPGAVSMEARAAQLRVASLARAAARVLPPVVLRVEQATGVPFGRVFRVFDVVEVDDLVPGVQARTVKGWLVRMQAGRAFDKAQAARYRFNQIYVTKDTGKGYWILDSYGPFDPALGAGPVSRKFTQLADIEVESARRMLQEAHRKYRPGMRFPDVRSRPGDLRDATIQGQLWLEIPVQTKAIPNGILSKASELSIKIRDIEGKVHQ